MARARSDRKDRESNGTGIPSRFLRIHHRRRAGEAPGDMYQHAVAVKVEFESTESLQHSAGPHHRMAKQSPGQEDEDQRLFRLDVEHGPLYSR
jgi:hypothetical protein